MGASRPWSRLKVENGKIRNKMKLQFANLAVCDPKPCAVVTMSRLCALPHVLELGRNVTKSDLVQLYRNPL